MEYYAGIDVSLKESSVCIVDAKGKVVRGAAGGFDTLSLIRAIDELDKMRGHLNDGDHHKPPEIRNDLLKLHDLAMDIVNEGVADRAQALFHLAFEIEDQLSDLSEALENIQETIPN